MPKTLRTETGPGPSSQGKIRPNSLFQIPPPIRAWSSRRLKPAVTGWAPLSLHCPQPSPGRWDTGDPRVSNPAGVGGCLGREHPDGPHMEHLSSICWGDLSVRPSLAALKRNMRQRRAGKVSDVSSEYSQHSALEEAEGPSLSKGPLFSLQAFIE